MEELDRLLESVWERGWRDTKAALHSLWFWVIEVFGGGAVALVWGGGFALIFVFGVAIALWIGATASAPLRQRREYQDELIAIKHRPEVEIGCEVAYEWKGYITVRNLGATYNFTANAKILETRNYQGVLRETPFKCKWANSTSKYVPIQTGDLERIHLVDLRQCQPWQRAFITLRQLEESVAASYIQYQWDNEPGKVKPEWDIEIEVLVPGLEYSKKASFRISISDKHPRGILDIHALVNRTCLVSSI